MSKLIFFITITLYSQIVSSSLFNFLSDTITEVSDKVKSAITSILPPDESVCLFCEDDIRSTHRTTTINPLEYENRQIMNLNLENSVILSTPQLALRQGWNIDSHLVRTQDGYILTLHRIRRPSSSNMPLNNQTVLLNHGFLGSSADWILLGPEKSLPYMLSNLGYDVWMANARGNYYSRSHVTWKTNTKKFWSFTWQQMGEFDLPAIVDFIRNFKNSNETINFIGHSMGATSFLVLLAMKQRYNEYFRMGILLAPLAFMKSSYSPLKYPTEYESEPFDFFKPSYSRNIWRLTGDGEFKYIKIPKWFYQQYCNDILCSNPIFFFCGPMRGVRDPQVISNVLSHVPAGASSDTIKHYAELTKSNRFHKYGNFFEYPLTKVTSPIVLFSSSDDQFATVSGVMKLYFKISRPIDHYVLRNQNISHTEFVWGSEADILVFDKVIEYLRIGVYYKRNEID